MSPDVPDRRNALVIGNGMMGLCAAEVLARHFEQVTVVDRDALPVDAAAARRGVPQSLQPHGLQVRGRLELDGLFPGLLDALRKDGAIEYDASCVARFGTHGWAPRYPHMDLTMMGVSRVLFETHMRRILRERRPNIRWIEGTRVTALLHESTGDRVRVTGVTTDSGDESLREIKASVVMDTTGRGSKVLKWIEGMGLPRPQELRVSSKSNYATRRYRVPKEAYDWWWRLMVVDAEPPDFTRACVLSWIEDDTWLVTASGINGDYAPTDEAAWLEWIAGLRSPMISRVLARAEPITDVIQNRTMDNIWRRMHEYPAALDGFLLGGDALCTFNPSYGQGVTGAALAALALDGALTDRTGPVDATLAKDYYTRAAEIQAQGWEYSTTMDFRWPGTQGERPPLLGLSLWASGWLEKGAIHDPELIKVITQLFDFGASKQAMLTPRFIARYYYSLVKSWIVRPKLLAADQLDPFAPPSTPRALPSEAGR